MTSDPLQVTQYRSPFAGLRVRMLSTALDLALLWLVCAIIEAGTGTSIASLRTRSSARPRVSASSTW